jgi:hypothetical protein
VAIFDSSIDNERATFENCRTYFRENSKGDLRKVCEWNGKIKEFAERTRFVLFVAIYIAVAFCIILTLYDNNELFVRLAAPLEFTILAAIGYFLSIYLSFDKLRRTLNSCFKHNNAERAIRVFLHAQKRYFSAASALIPHSVEETDKMLNALWNTIDQPHNGKSN